MAYNAPALLLISGSKVRVLVRPSITLRTVGTSDPVAQFEQRHKGRDIARPNRFGLRLLGGRQLLR